MDETSVNEPLQPDSTSNLSAVEDLADVELVENFTEFGLDAVVHSEDEAEVGEFDEDSEDSEDSDNSDEEFLLFDLYLLVVVIT